MPLTQTDYQNAATRLNCEVAVVRAVTEVESLGQGFLSDGRPIILFEAHCFSEFTQRRYDKSHPHLSSKTWNRDLYRKGAAEYDRLNQAIALDREAALKSASWGLFQIMGFNHEAAGFATVNEFVAAMQEAEANHLQAFLNFCESNGLAPLLKAKNWTDFARAYNGPGYKSNQYDAKLNEAYIKWSYAAPPPLDLARGGSGVLRFTRLSWLKSTSTVQAIEDSAALKVQPGDEFRITHWHVQNNHYCVSLSQPLNNVTVWYAFREHAQLIEAAGSLPAEVNLDVPYFSQLDNANVPMGTCNVTSVAMCLSYYQIPQRQANKQYEDELFELMTKRGWDRHVHDHLRQLFELYGVQDKFSTETTWDAVRAHLASGNPVIMSGRFTRSGHIIVLRGYNNQGFWVNDPYGEWFDSGYRRDRSGCNLHYSYGLASRVSYGGTRTTWAHLPSKM